MSVQDLLGQRQWAVESNAASAVQVSRKKEAKSAPVAHDGNIVLYALVVDIGTFFQQGHGDLCVTNSGCDGRHSSGQALERPYCIRSAI